MTGEKRRAEERLRICPECGQRKSPTSAICRECRRSERDEKRTRTDYSIGADHPHYGEICPRCGGYKNRRSRICYRCRGWRGEPIPETRDSLYTIGRSESIITFRHVESGALRTFNCVGRNRGGQVADGFRQLEDPQGWVVESRMTPQSVLDDLRRPPQENRRPL